MKNRTLNYILILLTVIVIPPVVVKVLTSYPLDIYTMAGVALIVVSTVLIVIARFQLGGSFSIKAEARELVTYGLYSRIRHPIYIFAGLLFLGMVLCVRSTAIFCIWLLMMLLQVLRARKEDRVLEEKFGEAYRKYRQGTWF